MARPKLDTTEEMVVLAARVPITLHRRLEIVKFVERVSYGKLICEILEEWLACNSDRSELAVKKLAPQRIRRTKHPQTENPVAVE